MWTCGTVPLTERRQLQLIPEDQIMAIFISTRPSPDTRIEDLQKYMADAMQYYQH